MLIVSHKNKRNFKKLRFRFVFRNFNLPKHRELRSSLSKIYGLGFNKAFIFMARLGFGYPYPCRYITNYQFLLITGYLTKILGGTVKLKKVIKNSIDLNVDNGTYRGLRHKLSLPVRGQRTRSNARTRKRLRLTAKS